MAVGVGGMPAVARVDGVRMTAVGGRVSAVLVGVRPVVARALVLGPLVLRPPRATAAPASRRLAAASVLILFHWVRLTYTRIRNAGFVKAGVRPPREDFRVVPGRGMGRPRKAERATGNEHKRLKATQTSTRQQATWPDAAVRLPRR